MPASFAGTPSANSPAAAAPEPKKEPKEDVTTPATPAKSNTAIWAAGIGLAAALMSALWFALGQKAI